MNRLISFPSHNADRLLESTNSFINFSKLPKDYSHFCIEASFLNISMIRVLIDLLQHFKSNQELILRQFILTNLRVTDSLIEVNIQLTPSTFTLFCVSHMILNDLKDFDGFLIVLRILIEVGEISQFVDILLAVFAKKLFHDIGFEFVYSHCFIDSLLSNTLLKTIFKFV